MSPLLQTVALGRAFGGLQAVRSVDLCLNGGEIRAIIGPNGAGKTTLVSMICGRLPPTSGKVLFTGRDITRLAAHDRVALGIVYTFQLISIYKKLTVYENVALSAQRRLLVGLRDHVGLRGNALAERVEGALAAVGLGGTGASPAGSLPHGHQRLVEVAMALALQPRLLVLDEPTQGLAPEDIAVLASLMRRLSAHAAVLLIEHNMDVVLKLSQRITVMDRGRIIAEGTPGEIETNPDVQRVYLGP